MDTITPLIKFMTLQFQPYREPVRSTLLRTGSIALVLAVIVSLRSGFSRLPVAFVLMLWPALGGHFVELIFLNVLRPLLPSRRGVQILARLAIWFAGGVVLLIGMTLTATLLHATHRSPPLWVGGVAFIGIELIAHLGLLIRRRPNIYNGLG